MTFVYLLHKKKFFYSGHILREEILYHKKEYNKFPEKEISLLILGGSQGAEIFGKITPEVISMLCKHGFNISIYQQCLNSQKKALFESEKN